MAAGARLTIDLGLNSGNLRNEFNASSRVVKGFGNEIDRVGKRMQTAFKVSALAITGFTTALGFGIKEIADYSTELTKLAASTQVTVVEFQKFSAIAIESGGNIEQAGKLIQITRRNVDELSRGAGTGFETLSRLGLAAKDFDNLSIDESFLRIVKALQELPDKNAVSALVTQIFGEEDSRAAFGLLGTDLGTLNDRLKQYTFISNQSAADTRQFDTSLTRLTSSLRAAATNALANGGVFTKLADAFDATTKAIGESKVFVTLAKIIGIATENFDLLIKSVRLFGEAYLASIVTSKLVNFLAPVIGSVKALTSAFVGTSAAIKQLDAEILLNKSLQKGSIFDGTATKALTVQRAALNASLVAQRDALIKAAGPTALLGRVSAGAAAGVRALWASIVGLTRVLIPMLIVAGLFHVIFNNIDEIFGFLSEKYNAIINGFKGIGRAANDATPDVDDLNIISETLNETLGESSNLLGDQYVTGANKATAAQIALGQGISNTNDLLLKQGAINQKERERVEKAENDELLARLDRNRGTNQFQSGVLDSRRNTGGVTRSSSAGDAGIRELLKTAGNTSKRQEMILRLTTQFQKNRESREAAIDAVLTERFSRNGEFVYDTGRGLLNKATEAQINGLTRLNDAQIKAIEANEKAEEERLKRATEQGKIARRIASDIAKAIANNDQAKLDQLIKEKRNFESAIRQRDRSNREQAQLRQDARTAEEERIRSQLESAGITSKSDGLFESNQQLRFVGNVREEFRTAFIDIFKDGLTTQGLRNVLKSFGDRVGDLIAERVFDSIFNSIADDFYSSIGLGALGGGGGGGGFGEKSLFGLVGSIFSAFSPTPSLQSATGNSPIGPGSYSGPTSIAGNDFSGADVIGGAGVTNYNYQITGNIDQASRDFLVRNGPLLNQVVGDEQRYLTG